MAAPTPNTRYVAHTAVGIAGGAIVQKWLGTGGLIVFLVSGLLVIWIHEALDAPVAHVMAELGLQF